MTEYNIWNIPDYKGNPLIEALPAYLSLKDFMVNIASKPVFSPEERFHNDLERDLYTERLDNCIIPLGEYYVAYKKIYKLILKSYISRNPIDPETRQLVYSVASKGKIPTPNKHKKTTADSIFITGLSGMGKSWMIDKIMELIFKQEIKHDEYNGHSLNFKQLVYVKFNCPGDASRRALLLNFFKAVDEATKNTNYAKENSLNTLRLHDLEHNMKVVCMNHHIGLVIMDELQNLSMAKSGGAKSAMRFFENIANEALVSLVFIGTYDCFDIYHGEFSVARRMAKNGIIDLQHPEINDPYWLKLLEKLWDAQWVQNPIKIFKSKDGDNADYDPCVAQDIINAIYFCSQGITVCTITLLKHANVYAIEQGLEKIDVDLIYEVYNNEFKLLNPALKVLEEKGAEGYKEYNELMPLAERIKEMRKRPELTRGDNHSNTVEKPEPDSEKLTISPDKFNENKRRKESASDVFNRLNIKQFFVKSMKELLD